MIAPISRRLCSRRRNQHSNEHARRLVMTFVGSSTDDVFCLPHIQILAGDGVVQWEDHQKGHDVRIPIEGILGPGSKRTALAPIDPVLFQGMIQKERPGGGALNQAVALARIARRQGVPVTIRYIDTGPSSEPVRQLCVGEGVEVFFLDRHNRLVNVAVCFPKDKGIVRSPVVLRGHVLDAKSRGLLNLLAQESDYTVGVSVKCPAVARQAWLAAREGGRLFQPTDSVAPDAARLMGTLADSVVGNVAEVYWLAGILGETVSPVDESSPCVPEAVAMLVSQLVARDVIGAKAVLATRGRYGSVAVMRERALSIEVDVSGDGVATRNGAGDLFHASWLFYRVLMGMEEPEASIRATRFVAEELGLLPGAYNLRVREFRLPLRGLQPTESR